MGEQPPTPRGHFPSELEAAVRGPRARSSLPRVFASGFMAVVPSGVILSPGNIWQGLETLCVVTSGAEDAEGISRSDSEMPQSELQSRDSTVRPNVRGTGVGTPCFTGPTSSFVLVLSLAAPTAEPSR